MNLYNPYNTRQHLKNSKYFNFEKGRLTNHSLGAMITDNLVHRDHIEVLRLVAGRNHHSLGVSSSFHTRSYRLGVYEEIASDAATAGLAHDLLTFLQDKGDSPSFFSFVAAFFGETEFNEKEFSIMLYQQLYKLHQLDKEHFEWDDSVSNDPHSLHFGFSFGGKAFQVTGLHANASRISRTFPYPVIIFNMHAQLQNMKKEGTYQKLKTMIRQRDLRV
jgi:FPC/CPF motif-containing protein YcgG